MNVFSVCLRRPRMIDVKRFNVLRTSRYFTFLTFLFCLNVLYICYASTCSLYTSKLCSLPTSKISSQCLESIPPAIIIRSFYPRRFIYFLLLFRVPDRHYGLTYSTYAKSDRDCLTAYNSSTVSLRTTYRILIRSHTLPVKCNHQRAGRMTISARSIAFRIICGLSNGTNVSDLK